MEISTAALSEEKSRAVEVGCTERTRISQLKVEIEKKLSELKQVRGLLQRLNSYCLHQLTRMVVKVMTRHMTSMN